MKSMPSKTRILMVCLGNICRSPLAHGILASKLPEDKFFIDSAGTSAFHIGNSPDQRSISVAKSNNIDISHQKARQFEVRDFDNFDIIYAMDNSNYNNIVALTENNAHRKKVKFILIENPSIKNKDVPDPYYGNTSDFEYVFKILNETCEIIAQDLK